LPSFEDYSLHLSAFASQDSTIRQKLNGQTDFYRDDSQSDGLKKLSLPEDFIPTQVVSHYPKMYKPQFFLGVLQCLSQLVAHFVLRFAFQVFPKAALMPAFSNSL